MSAVGIFTSPASRPLASVVMVSALTGCTASAKPAATLAAFGALQALAESALAPGGRFCEWGSGFGVVTCLAAMIGFDACGIEIEPDLVAAARRLAADFDLSAEFVCGSFVPRGGEACLG